MTFQQFRQSWWGWGVCLVIAIAAGIQRHWDTLAWVLLGIAILLGCVRLLLASFRGVAIRNLVRMSPEERERMLRNCSPERRAQIEKDIRDYALRQRNRLSDQ